MKRITTILLLVTCLLLTGQAQTLDCNSFCIKSIEFDTITSPPFNQLYVTVKNNDSIGISHFSVIAVMDENGDTLTETISTTFLLPTDHTGTFDLTTSLNTFPQDFKGKVAIGVAGITHCVLEFPCIPLGIERINHTEVNVFPNPAQEVLTVKLDNSIQQGVLQLLSIAGQVVHQELISGGQSTIDVSQFSGGIYLVRVQLGPELIIRKVRITE